MLVIEAKHWHELSLEARRSSRETKTKVTEWDVMRALIDANGTLEAGIAIYDQRVNPEAMEAREAE